LASIPSLSSGGLCILLPPLPSPYAFQETTMPAPSYITTLTGTLTTPPGSPKILIHTRQRDHLG
jgi:hypothetical protein